MCIFCLHYCLFLKILYLFFLEGEKERAKESNGDKKCTEFHFTIKLFKQLDENCMKPKTNQHRFRDFLKTVLFESSRRCIFSCMSSLSFSVVHRSLNDAVISNDQNCELYILIRSYSP